MSALKLQLNDYRLTTVEIIYHRPDHPSLLQEFIWQEMDLAPAFPVLSRFLNFWQSNLDGKLHSVRVASCGLIQVPAFSYADGVFTLN
ncbi:MAG: Usg family protein [Rhodospirillales bacterium]|nr:Usg family protein [Rhodospirillales bacterium]